MPLMRGRRQLCPEVALARVKANGYPDALAVRIFHNEPLIEIVMPPIAGEDHSQPKPRWWLEALIDAHERGGTEAPTLDLFSFSPRGA